MTIEPRMVHRAHDVADALATLAAADPHHPWLVVAGATDVFVALHRGAHPAAAALDISGLEVLRGITVRGEHLVIGALCTFRDLQHSTVVAAHCPLLAEIAGVIGSPQIQNRATIGGNVMNASASGDCLPLLAVLEATLVLASSAGERRIAIGDHLRELQDGARPTDELLLAVEVPPVLGRLWFRKVGARAAQTVSKVVIAALDGSRPRIALGGVAPTVRRLTATERALAAAASADDVVRAMHAEIEPIDDIRSTAAYRRLVAENLVRRFIADRG